MSTKKFHAVQLYANHLRTLTRKMGRAVSAGEVARYAGVSRTTAKKYLELTVREGLSRAVRGEHFNGMIATGYIWGEDENSWKS